MAEIPGSLSSEFIKAAIWHGSLDAAEAMLLKYPDLAKSNIHIAAILGDYQSVGYFINQNAQNATATAEPFGGNALVYLSLSKYLRLGKRPADDFLKTAELLLDSGADANSGFWTAEPYKEFETALYGAAGVAQNAALTRLLLERGADPNDEEAVYHSPETWDNAAMELLVNTGKLTPFSLLTMLLRKHDFHDYNGAKFLLEHGADPNIKWRRGFYAIHHALTRCNSFDIIRLLLDHGADPNVIANNLTAIAHAAREGRGDILALLKQRGIPLNLHGVDQLIAACAEDDGEEVDSVIIRKPALVEELKAMGGTLLARFAAGGNQAGVKLLLDAGVGVNMPYREGDAYFITPKNSLAIHVAAWRGYPEVVKLLIERGAPVDEPDANGDTPIMLAVWACVDSYWTYRRSPDSVKALLDAGASPDGITYPTGYDEVDKLLHS